MEITEERRSQRYTEEGRGDTQRKEGEREVGITVMHTRCWGTEMHRGRKGETQRRKGIEK